jgi:parallel beta-helix repeat protein
MSRKLLLLMLLALLIGTLNLASRVEKTKASGTIYIRADGSVEPEGTPISTFDNVTYTFAGNINDSVVIERDNIVVDGAGYTVQGTEQSGTGIYMSGGANVTVQNTQVQNFAFGIRFQYSPNNTITGNTVENCSYGIDLYSSDDSAVFGNMLDNFGYDGIGLSFSCSNSIVENSVRNCTQQRFQSSHGVYIDQSSNNNTVSGNSITVNSEYGIYLCSSSNNSIYGNNIANSEYGIYLCCYPSNNTVYGNNITANNCGIVLGSSSNYNSIYGNNIANSEYGIYLYSSSNNKLFHNSFVNNDIQVYLESSDSANIWDDGYPSGGNYWSDYTGVDSNLDGIGDSNYTIDADNDDRYPLMGLFSEFDWISIAAPEQRIQTICNSTISNLVYNGTAICFNVSGQSETTGFCRICIPRVLMNSTYEVFVNGTKVHCNELNCSDSTYAYLYFNYTHSTKEVIIIPEFSSFLILSLFMIVTLMTVVVYKRRYSKKDVKHHSVMIES